MINLFATGTPQEINAVLANRDQRAALQNKLVNTTPANKSVVTLKLNIPGPIKNNAALTQLFKTGFATFKQALTIQRQIDWDQPTGPEAY